MEHLPFRDGAFDVLVCSLSLQYVRQEKVGEVLSAWKRLLRSGGRLLLTYPNITTHQHLRRPGEDEALSWEELRDRVAGAGFSVMAEQAICRLLPPRMVAWSHGSRAGKLAAGLYYLAANRVLRPALARAYHALLVARAP